MSYIFKLILLFTLKEGLKYVECCNSIDHVYIHTMRTNFHNSQKILDEKT